MKTLKHLLFAALFALLPSGALMAQTTPITDGSGERIITFRFVPGEDMFYIPWEGNDAQLNALYALVDQYRAEISSGRIPVYVDGYSSSMRSADRNRELAFIRANRVKSELITHKGLTEDNFITRNHTTSYTGSDGITHKDMVVVTLRIPAREEPKQEVVAEQPRHEEPPVREEPRREEPAVTERPPREEPAVVEMKEEAVMTLPAKDSWKYPYCFAVRTNLLYDAFLLPTLGVEWRVSPSVGIKLDGGLAWWGSEHGKVQKIWLLNPEVRWYMGGAKRFYLGLGGNYAECNTYGFLLGKLWTDNTGYQGSFWNAGLTLGYQVTLSHSLALDFNLGLGYTKFEYDSFTIQNEIRVYKEKDKSKNFWGPTQAGISFVWTIGGNK